MNTEEFVEAVRARLLGGEKHSTPGLGTFSTCTRKAAPGRPQCRMAMFRADAALRARIDGAPERSGVEFIVGPLVEHGAVVLPALGRIEIVVGKKKTKVVFRGDPSLNDALTDALG